MITHFISQPAAQAFTGYFAASDKPDTAEVRLQSLVHQAFEIAAVELYGIPGLLQLATGEDEGRLVAVGPAQSLGLEIQRGFIAVREPMT